MPPKIRNKSILLEKSNWYGILKVQLLTDRVQSFLTVSFCVNFLTSFSSFSFANDIEYMTGSRPNAFWLICWKYLSPLALIVVFIASVVKTGQSQASYTAYVGCKQVSLDILVFFHMKCRLNESLLNFGE